MKLTSLFLALSMILLTAFPAASQQVLNSDNLRSVQVDLLSDEEISSYYQKAKSSGLSDEQLFRLAADRGMPAEQISKLKARLSSLTMGPSKKVQTEAEADKMKSERISAEASKPMVMKVPRDSSIFGSELFSEVSSVFEPNYKIATPASYILGPGDELVIQVFGYSEQTYNVTVNAEGSIYIPNVGPIGVSGMSVEDASSRIRNKLATTIYKAIRSGQTRVQVSLGRIKSISVTVIGQATKPGTYTVPSLSTVFNLLYLCGGPSGQGSFRTIELIRGNKVYRTIDIYAFLLRGDRKDNVLLQDQDVIRIPYYNTRVTMLGQVKREGKFEMLPRETLDQLMTYCGGFADSAYKAVVKVIRIADTGRLLADIPAAQFGSFVPQSGDAFSVGKAPSRFNNRVMVKGAVFRAEDYELKPGMQLRSLLEVAGLRPDTYRERGLISRLNDDQTLSSISFNINQVMEGKVQIALQREDIVSISSVYDLKDAQVVEIQGEIRNPNKYAFRKDMTVRDLLLLAGGLTEAADAASVEISRRIVNMDVASEAYTQAEIIRLDLRGEGDAGKNNMLLKPFDVVTIRPRGSFEVQRRVMLAGQVLSPGPYVLQTSKETISSLIRRAGGFKSSADSSSISIRRVTSLGLSGEERQRTIEKLLSIDRDSLVKNPSLRETYLRNVDFLSVNVQNIKDDPGGPEDLILEDGDYIEVARASNLVRVSGEVYHASMLPFEGGASAHYYIKRSGNFTSNARRKRTFVIYPDGRAKSVKSFLFFKSYPDVTARSEIYVPSKDKEGKKGLTTGEWIAISSIIASLTTMAITIANAFQ